MAIITNIEHELLISLYIATTIIIFSIALDRVLRFIINRKIEKSERDQKGNKTKYQFIKNSLTALIYIVGISLAIYNIPQLRAVSVSLLAGAGVMAVAIGFASQHALSNIISGVFIVIFKPFKIGDRIKVGADDPGIVEDITLRHTVIRTFENKRIVIPNSIISEERIENSQLVDDKVCKFIEFGISYDSNVDLAKLIMEEEALKHPYCIDNRTIEEKEQGKKQVEVKLISFGDSSVNLRAWVWTENPGNAFDLGCDLNESIKKRFDKEDIEIPFPYRTIVYKDKK
ncbi:mechanosensitive ion channel family protein [Candidatus Woesearchaeota archaeon]|nr:mechanosensitive ion channel family protein [Candidatus Woesearchaeota archaeon]